MAFTELINKHYKNFSSTDIGIAEYIQENPQAVWTMGLLDFARESLSSKSSVLRFCQKIGFTGYTEMRNFLKWHMQLSQECNLEYSFAEQVQKDTAVLLGNIKQVDWDPVYRAINEARNIFIVTTGVTQQNQALEFQRLLMLSGKNSGIIVGNKNTSEFLRMSENLSSDDLIAVLSLSGDNSDLESVIQKIKLRNAKLLSITNYSNNWLSKNCDFNLYAHSSKSPLPGDWWLKTTSTFFVLIETFVFGFNDYLRKNK